MIAVCGPALPITVALIAKPRATGQAPRNEPAISRLDGGRHHRLARAIKGVRFAACDLVTQDRPPVGVAAAFDNVEGRLEN